ncbi:hypothetical protein LUZ63_016934 [Rhynchospora breviuscula]|uniref:C2H2-type domain-containing protein n=1 Tax=Rhynchospora breviuscula TaxID=2022672 RepID=A0A9Q0HF70_9POAL|nr:hypothetical protein LUZ63_016934 [Rhynchospora breviuscula]
MDSMDASVASPDLGLGFGFPFWVASRRRFKPDDPFFASGNLERELLAKHVALDLTEDEHFQLQMMEIADANLFCPIAGCGSRLEYLEEFEDHYNTRHMASCSVCSRVYPTSRLLSIHISEVHDSFFQAKVARGFPMYECLVEGCGANLKSYKSRQRHLIDKHRFPSSFEFYKKAHPSKHQRQKLQRKAYKGGDAKDHESFMDLDAKKESKQTHPKHYRPKQELKTGTEMESEMEVETKLHHPQTTETKVETNTEAKNEKAKTETEMEVEERIDDIVSGISKLSTVDSSSPSSVSFGHRHSRGFAFVPRSVRNQNQVSKREPTRKP